MVPVRRSGYFTALVSRPPRKDFFNTSLASLAALVFVAGGFFVLFFGFLAAAGASARPPVPPKAILVFDLSMNLPDHLPDPVPGDVLGQLTSGREKGLPLAAVVSALRWAAKDDRIAALSLTGNPVSLAYGSGLPALKEVREAVQAFKASGKPVLAYNLAWTKKAYYLAAGAGTLYVHPMGGVEVMGFASEPTFYGEAFKKYGIEVQVTRVGKYKSAVEPFISDRMSEPNREQVAKLLGDLWAHWKGAVAEDRKLSPEVLQVLADEKGVLVGEEAKAAGLVDRVASYDVVLDELKVLAGRTAKDTDFPQVSMERYADSNAEEGHGRNRVAVVYAEGDIVDGEGGDGFVGGERLSRQLRLLRLDPHVKAIVLRVNSPGGSATASELIQREVVLARKAKPVVISMGTLAASGGYWISIYGDRIFAEPSTITGSIGVFGMLPNIKKLANEHGVTWDSVQTSKLANPFTLSRPKSEAELARIQHLVDGVYDQFIAKVAEGRKLPRAKVEEIAQGRVWSGTEALNLGLVDEMGGLREAVQFAAKKAGIEKDYRMDLPGPRKPPFQRLMESLGREEHPTAGVVRGPVGELVSEAQRQVRVLGSLNDPQGAYARMPLDLAFR